MLLILQLNKTLGKSRLRLQTPIESIFSFASFSKIMLHPSQAHFYRILNFFL